MSTEPKHAEGLLSLEDVAAEAAAEVSEGGELAALREGGKDLVNYLYMSLRTLSIHAAENQAVREPLGRLVGALGELSKYLHSIHLITVEGQIYLNDLRIKMDASAFDNVKFMLSVFEKHGIGGLTFHGGMSGQEVKDLMLLLLRHVPPAGGDKDEALDSVREAMREAGLTKVTADKPYFFRSAESSGAGELSQEAAEQEQAALAYSKGVLAVKDYFRAVEAAEAANPLRIRKIVHDMVDVADESPDDFLKLHTIQGIEDVYYNHCVNVSSLAVGIGRELGLSRVQLAELGSAAMFHDLGYAALEREAHDKGRVLSDEDRKVEHPVAGFKSLLKQAEYGPGLMRRLLVTLEHHMHYERPGGYPALGKKPLSVYTRIFQVADTYDALVTAHGDNPPLLPVQALEAIVHQGGTAFDPVVVRAFVHVVGRYPYGSLVELNTGEVGVVTCGGRDRDKYDKPKVMVVRSADGSACEPREVDLADKKVLERRVQSVLNPFDEELTPHAVLFSDLGQALDDDGGPDVSAAAAEVAASMSLDAWNRAVWEEGDPMTALSGAAATVQGGLLSELDPSTGSAAEVMEPPKAAYDPFVLDQGESEASGELEEGVGSQGPEHDLEPEVEAEADREDGTPEDFEESVQPAPIPHVDTLAATADQVAVIDDPFAPEPSALLPSSPADTAAVTVADVAVLGDQGGPQAISPPRTAPPAPPSWMEEGDEEELAESKAKVATAEQSKPSDTGAPPPPPAWMDELGETKTQASEQREEDNWSLSPLPPGVLTPTDEMPVVPDTLDELQPLEPDEVADPFGGPLNITGTPLVDPTAPTLLDELEEHPLAPAAAEEPSLSVKEPLEQAEFTEDEIARRKKAWQAAIQRAFAEGGEEAVQALSELSWRDFEPED